MIILLAPEKLITSTTKWQWQELSGKQIALFTSYAEPYCEFLKDWQGSVFSHVEFFNKYPSNDMVEIKVLEYATRYEIENIVPMTEADVFRCVMLKEKLGITGMSFEDAQAFRNKLVMKEIALVNDITVPRFKKIASSLDLIDFVKEVGYPFIIKPIQGRGSLDTFRISNQEEMYQFFDSGFISDTSRYPDLLAEEYLEAEIYHIDGLRLNNETKVMSISKYVNNCLSFVNGSYLGSYTLTSNNPLRKRLAVFVEELIEIYPFPQHTIFHIEVFVDNDNNISLCEVACRLGGNGINDEVRLQQGFDIKMEFIKAECGLKSEMVSNDVTFKVAGRLLIPPRNGKLVSIPTVCTDDSVIKYQARGKEGHLYKKMAMSNDEIANFLIKSGNETEMCEKINQLAYWFNQQVVWEN